MPITIFRRETNAKETWLLVEDDGSIVYHVENSGWPLMRSGIQARETTYTLEDSEGKVAVVFPGYRRGHE